MASHLGQSIANHVTLELVGGINGGYGPDSLGWTRVMPDGGIATVSGGGNFVVPRAKFLVITDADWQFDDHGTSNAGAHVVMRLFIVKADDLPRRLMESTIVLSSTGQGGAVATWTAGGVFGPGTKIGIDVAGPVSAKGLQHVLLHGYLVANSKP